MVDPTAPLSSDWWKQQEEEKEVLAVGGRPPQLLCGDSWWLSQMVRYVYNFGSVGQGTVRYLQYRIGTIL
jgi:hypothetical protein